MDDVQNDFFFSSSYFVLTGTITIVVRLVTYITLTHASRHFFISRRDHMTITRLPYMATTYAVHNDSMHNILPLIDRTGQLRDTTSK